MGDELHHEKHGQMDRIEEKLDRLIALSRVEAKLDELIADKLDKTKLAAVAGKLEKTTAQLASDAEAAKPPA